MNPEILILILLSSSSVFLSFKQLKKMEGGKETVKECIKKNMVDCGCGCSGLKYGVKNKNYNLNYDNITSEI